MAVRGRRESILEQHEPSWKCTVILMQTQVAYLDRIAVDLRERGVIVSRAELIYALIEAAMRSGVDLSEAASEQELVDLLAKGARERPPRNRARR